MLTAKHIIFYSLPRMLLEASEDGAYFFFFITPFWESMYSFSFNL